MAGPANKYKFSGIGNASAKLVMAFLVSQGQVWAAGGIWANIVSWFLAQAFSMGASMGLVLVNVGADAVEELIDKNGFDGSFDSAEKLLDSAHQAHQELTPEQIAAIDAPVKNAFRKFGQIANGKPDPNTNSSTDIGGGG